MSEMPDKELIEAIRAGNQQAFAEFLHRYKNLVRNIVARMINHAADREDLGQEIFYKIYNNLEKFRFASKVSTWVAKIAYTTCLNYLQKKKVALLEDIEAEENDQPDALERYPHQGVSPLEHSEQEQLKTIMQQAIAELPVTYRTVITLYHLQEMSYAEICEIMELPEGTVKSHLFRARKMLRLKLMKMYAEEAIPL